MHTNHMLCCCNKYILRFSHLKIHIFRRCVKLIMRVCACVHSIYCWCFGQTFLLLYKSHEHTPTFHSLSFLLFLKRAFRVHDLLRCIKSCLISSSSSSSHINWFGILLSIKLYYHTNTNMSTHTILLLILWEIYWHK